jgi:PDZ domain-containing protein
VALLSKAPVTAGEPPPAPARPVPARVVAAAVAAVIAAAGAVLVTYHPPRLVVTSGAPIDVSGDIRVSGLPVHDVRGRYLLLWVRTVQPDLAGWLAAVARGDTIVGIDPAQSTASDRAAAFRAGRAEYQQSRRWAVACAATAAGVDARRLSVTIRDRNLVGPSAGLVYALALTDMLSGQDLARGRVIAATGALEPDCRVDAVGWPEVKAAAATSAHAAVLLVPLGEQPDAYGAAPTVASAPTVAAAVRILGAGPRGP